MMIAQNEQNREIYKLLKTVILVGCIPTICDCTMKNIPCLKKNRHYRACVCLSMIYDEQEMNDNSQIDQLVVRIFLL